MNFLGHAYLSFGNPTILVGNMVSDFVKGRAQYNFPEDIQKGIRLHRYIDAFTDEHPATKAAREVFRSHYRLYSAPLMDVVYDHLLANDHGCFEQDALLHFTNHTYSTIEGYTHLLPPRFASVFSYMKKDNWLYGYQSEAGIFRSIKGLMYRASLADDGSMACTIMQQEKAYLQTCYDAFIGDVKEFAKARYSELIQ